VFNCFKREIKNAAICGVFFCASNMRFSDSRQDFQEVGESLTLLEKLCLAFRKRFFVPRALIAELGVNAVEGLRRPVWSRQEVFQGRKVFRMGIAQAELAKSKLSRNAVEVELFSVLRPFFDELALQMRREIQQ
jgi:hypothetical protein